MAALFEREMFAVMTPMVVSSGRTVSAAGEPESGGLRGTGAVAGECRTAVRRSFRSGTRSTGSSRCRVPTSIDYMLLEDALQMHVHRFFPGLEVRDCTFFRVTRNADMRVQEDSASDLLAGMQQVLIARKQSACVRLEIAAGAGATIREFLQAALTVHDGDVYRGSRSAEPVRLHATERTARLRSLAVRAVATSTVPARRSRRSAFSTRSPTTTSCCSSPMKATNRSCGWSKRRPTTRTCWRSSRFSIGPAATAPIVAALKRAAENGKHVTAIVELKARFDEARNIDWAKRLEAASVQVIYGVKGLKTHAKICLVLRREPTGIRRYVHYGTGNYNEITSRAVQRRQLHDLR